MSNPKIVDQIYPKVRAVIGLGNVGGTVATAV